VVFVHGLGFASPVWSKQFASCLSNDLRLIAFDLRGHGRSGKPEGGYDRSEVWADDLAAVVEQCELEQPVIVAWSYGGLVVPDHIRLHGQAHIAGIVFAGAANRIGTAGWRHDLGLTGTVAIDRLLPRSSEELIAGVDQMTARPLPYDEHCLWGSDRSRQRGHRGLGAHSPGVRPSNEHGGRNDSADAGQLEQLRGVLGDQLGDICPAACEIFIEGADASGQADGLTTAGSGGGLLVAVAPGGDHGDLTRGQRLRRIDAEVEGAHQRGQRVDGAGPFPGHLLTSHDEHTHCDPRPFARQFAWGSQAGEVQPTHRPGDLRGVEFVVLADATTVAGRHPGGFDDGQPGTLQPLGHDRAEGPGALYDDERGPLADAVLQPALRS